MAGEIDYKKLMERIQNARPAAAAPAPPKQELAGFHSTDAGTGGKRPAVTDKGADALGKTVASSPEAAAPQGLTVQPPGSEAATANLGPAAKPQTAIGGVMVAIDSNSVSGIKLFGMRVSELKRIIAENKAEIQASDPELAKIFVTLRLEKEKFALLEIEPGSVAGMLKKKLEDALEALSGDVRGENDPLVYTCRFEYTVIWNASVLDAPAVPSGAREALSVDLTGGLLGSDGEALVSEGRMPLLREMCNPYPLPDANGYAFVAYERNGPVPTMRTYEIRLEKEDESGYFIGVYKIKDGKRVPADEKSPILIVSKAAMNETYAIMEEGLGLEVSFSTFRGGVRSMRVDPLDLQKKESAAPIGYGQEIATFIVGAGAAATLFFLPELAEHFRPGMMPETVSISTFTLPVQQFLTWASAAIGALDLVLIGLGISGRKKQER